MIQRLGKNLGAYRGECIDITKVLEEISAAAEQGGWQRDVIVSSGGQELSAYHLRRATAKHRLYLSTGIHGDEPAGPLAIRELLRQNRWPQGLDLWLCPCLNLTGFPLNTREDARGIDLNRDYRHFRSPEIRAHAEWLRRQPNFDLAICLHEDWEANGFYLYELNPDGRPSLAEKIVEDVSRVCPIDTADKIDGWDAKHGIIRPNVKPEDRPEWAESLFLITHNTRQTYTFESPSDYPIETRVAAQMAAVETVLEHFS